MYSFDFVSKVWFLVVNLERFPQCTYSDVQLFSDSKNKECIYYIY